MDRLINLCGQALALRHDLCRATVSSRADAKARTISGRLLAFLRFRSEGQSLVEFALVLPMLLMVLLGIFVFGMTMQNFLQLTNVENQGLITLEQLPINAGDPCATVAAAVIGAAANLKTTGKNGIQMSITFGTGASAVPYPGKGTMSSPTDFSCEDASQYVLPGSRVSLTLTYPYNLTIYGMNYSSSLFQLTESEQI